MGFGSLVCIYGVGKLLIFLFLDGMKVFKYPCIARKTAKVSPKFRGISKKDILVLAINHWPVNALFITGKITPYIRKRLNMHNIEIKT